MFPNDITRLTNELCPLKNNLFKKCEPKALGYFVLLFVALILKSETSRQDNEKNCPLTP